MIYLHTYRFAFMLLLLGCSKRLARGNDKIRVTVFPSDCQPPSTKKITEAFDIRFPNLSPPDVDVRPCIQVDLLVTYQAHPPRLVVTS